MWIPPIIVAQKLNGSISFYVDLWATNRTIAVEAYPLPTVEELVNSLAGAQHFSKLDLTSTYHQGERSPESRDLTTFITNQGLFRFKLVLQTGSCTFSISEVDSQRTEGMQRVVVMASSCADVQKVNICRICARY